MFTELDLLVEEGKKSGRPYLEFVRTSALSAGLYVLEVGAADARSPHTEDEVYFVISGGSQMTVADETRTVGPGSVVFVEPGVPHKFHEIKEELRALVFFAPAQGSLTEA